VNHMTELIDDLLDVSRVTSGLISLHLETLNIAPILNSAIEQVRSLIDSRNQQLRVEVEPNIPLLRGDQTRLTQVLANLINNASKYSPHEGKISIAVKRVNSQIAISVSDSGLGISAELLPRVFDLFAQAERTSDRAQGGLGLGLAIVKNIVELHGGSVSAFSDGIGTGAKFEILLPAFVGTTASLSSTSEEARPQPRKLKIVIVDDNRDAAESLASVLATEGHNVTVEFSGISLLQQVEHIERQDAFILDIGLPVMDGYQLVAELLKNPVSANSHMVALTGYGQSHDRAIGKVAGFHDYFVKPIKSIELAALLAAIALRAI
jgi:CheY-like chemotaxis protein/two-component sensor histidine kinase